MNSLVSRLSASYRICLTKRVTLDSSIDPLQSILGVPVVARFPTDMSRDKIVYECDKVLRRNVNMGSRLKSLI